MEALRKDMLVAVGAAALAKVVVLVATYVLLGRPDDFVHRLAWNWDGEHYLGIVNNGYQRDLDGPGTSMAFAFLYPRLIELAGGTAGAALAISNLCSLLAVAVVAWHWGRGPAIAFALFPPWLVFGTVAYSEGLYVLLAALALAAIERGRHLAAGFAGGLAACARYFGGPALLLASLPFGRWRDRRGWVTALVIGAFGLGLWGWMWRMTGTPLAYIAAQRHDLARSGWPWEHFGFVLHGYFTAQGGPVAPWGNLSSLDFFARDVLYTIAIAAGFTLLWRHHRATATTGPSRVPSLVYSGFAILTAYCVIGMPAMALPRYLVAAFPAIAAFGTRLRGRLAWSAYAATGLMLGIDGLVHHLYAYWS